MTPEEIIDMAKLAEIQTPEEYHGDATADCPWMATTEELIAFAKRIERRVRIEVADENDY
jgi:hypothetical protein